MSSVCSIDRVLQDAATATGNGTVLEVAGLGAAALQVTGTFAGTITFEATVDRSNWVSLQVANVADGSVSTTATAAGAFLTNIAGLSRIRARISAYTSGSITVVGQATEAAGGLTLADIDIAGTEIVTVADIQDGAGDSVMNATANAIKAILQANSGVDIGDVDVTSLPASVIAGMTTLPAGTNAIGKLAANSGVDIGDVDVTSIAAGDNNIGNVDVLTLPALESATVTEYNVTLTNADTEYSQSPPSNCRKLTFRCRSDVAIRYAWATGKVAGPTAPFQTLKAGADYGLDGVKIASGTLYLASATAGVVVEIEAWT